MLAKKLKNIAVLLIFAVSLSACGDNGTGADEGNPPQVPDLEFSQPDFSYFQNNTVQGKSVSNNYLAAQSIVLGFSGVTSIGQIYGGFLSSAPQNEASLEDGVWEWAYSYSYMGASSEMRMTAEESGGATSWAVYWSFSDGQGNSVEDYNIMNGTIQNDGLSGDWTFNSLDPETNNEVPAYTSSWIADGEGEHSLDLEIFDESSSSVETLINFDKTGDEFLMTASGSSAVEVSWNPDSGLGYIQQDMSDPLCWDSSGATIVDVECSALGL
jgi:hypothetical protein